MSLSRSIIVSFIIAAALTAPAVADKKRKKDAADQVSLPVGRTPYVDPEAPPPPPPPPAVPTTTIAQEIGSSPDYKTLSQLMSTAQLSAALSAPGPITIFAPSEDAFARLAPGTVATLSKPENLASLTRILKYHVVSGALTVEDIKARITAGNGVATIPTLEGDSLRIALVGDAMELTDSNGNKAYITQADRKESNGVIQRVNGVVLPKLG